MNFNNIKILKKKKKYNFKYYFKNLYLINYKILLVKFYFLFNYLNINFIKLNKLKKQKTIKFKIQINNYLNMKTFLIKYFQKKNFYLKLNSFLFTKKKLKTLKFLPDNLPFLNLLKNNKSTILKLDNLINDYGYIYLKSSGINTFITLTNSEGNVLLLILREFLKM